jgi:hydroxymethylbilane synthase
MKQKLLRIATRQSPLALWQAGYIRDQLLKLWPMLIIELVPMITSGDKFVKDKLLVAGGKGLFVKELEEALLDNRADIAVHSTKDVPAELPQGLHLAIICKRDNPFDALISKNHSSLDTLPQNAIIGTASLRRQAQLLAYRPDFQIKTLRGNINTRLAKLEANEYNAIILATAGLERMNMMDKITEILSSEIMLPTCAQGALSIECRINDEEINQIISPLNDTSSALCIKVERRVNAQLGGNCHVPLAVFCSIPSLDQLYLQAKIFTIDGSKCIESNQKGTIHDAFLLADNCAQSLIQKGAKTLIKSALS